MSGQRWDVLYPRRKGLWAGFSGTHPIQYDPVKGTVRVVDPRTDVDLPQLDEWLELGELMAYRAGMRATVRIKSSAGVWYAKVTTARRADRVIRAEAAIPPRLRARSGGRPAAATRSDHREGMAAGRGPARGFPLSAAPLGPTLHLATHRAVIDGAVLYPRAPGTSLHDILRTGDARGTLRRVGAALADLHVSPLADVRSGAPHPLSAWATWAEEHDPRCPPWLVAAARAFDDRYRPEPEPEVLVHGDLHDKNVIVGSDRVVLIDLGSVRRGRPSEDVGMMCAHVVLRALQDGRSVQAGARLARVFASAYSDAGGPATTSAVDVEARRTLARLACLYRLRRRWHHVTSQLMGAATSLVAA